MRSDELRELPVVEVQKHLDETREELFNLRFQGATGQLENYKRLGAMRREIARTLTILRERELGIVRELAEGAGAAEEDEAEGGRRRRRRRRDGEDEEVSTPATSAGEGDEE
jgi:large subunit ribosomal protein L29